MVGLWGSVNTALHEVLRNLNMNGVHDKWCDRVYSRAWSPAIVTPIQIPLIGDDIESLTLATNAEKRARYRRDHKVRNQHM